MSKYLIRRNSVFSEFKNIRRINSPKKGYSETVITKQDRYPKSVKLEEGDTVYVSETGVGIFAKGKVIGGVVENPETEIPTCNSIKDILERYDIESQSSYWADKIVRFHNKKRADKSYKFRYHQYFIDQKLLQTTIPFEGPLKKYIQQGYAWSLTELNEEESEFVENPVIPPNTKLQLEIPSRLKFELHALFNKEMNVSHWIDIDHLIPKSLGGPGNIKENLVPIGFSLNRYKNNSIPVNFFSTAENMLDWDLKPETKEVVSKEKNLVNVKNNSSIYDEVKMINTEIWDRGIETAKSFYGRIMRVNYPEYFRIISSE